MKHFIGMIFPPVFSDSSALLKKNLRFMHYWQHDFFRKKTVAECFNNITFLSNFAHGLVME
jgi:hypothetical protein